MDYPESMPCGQKSPGMKYDVPCPGTALRFAKPPLKLDNDRGDWYGCPSCGRVCQYQDVIEGRPVAPAPAPAL